MVKSLRVRLLPHQLIYNPTQNSRVSSRRASWAHPQGRGEKLRHPGGISELNSCFFWVARRQMRRLQIPPGSLPAEVFQACATGEKKRRVDPKEAGGIFTSCLAWKRLRTRLEELEDKAREEGRLYILLNRTQKEWWNGWHALVFNYSS